MNNEPCKPVLLLKRYDHDFDGADHKITLDYDRPYYAHSKEVQAMLKNPDGYDKHVFSLNEVKFALMVAFNGLPSNDDSIDVNFHYSPSCGKAPGEVMEYLSL
jgi:hypothetical protein